jgi:hypothetical protein
VSFSMFIGKEFFKQFIHNYYFYQWFKIKLFFHLIY